MTDRRRRKEYRAALNSARQALVALRRAEIASGCWADNYREDAEKRHGDDTDAILNDPEYGKALDVLTPALSAVKAAEELVRLLEQRADDTRHRDNEGKEVMHP
jgi:hypothetical protein